MEDDDITVSISGGDLTFDLSDYTVDTIDLSSITTNTIDTISIDTADWADTITWNRVEFEDEMPSVAKVEDMCNNYPALEKAYENFKTIYKMVHQDWKGRQDEDDQLPF